MEEVVSSVSTPEKAEEIIKSEQSKLLEEKNIREFSNIKLIEELIDMEEVHLQDIVQIYSESRSIDDLARKLESSTDVVNADRAIDHWHNHPNIVEDINHARSLLGKEALEFEA